MAVNVVRSSNTDHPGFFTVTLRADAAGGVVVIPTDGFFRPGVVNQGFTFQAKGGTVPVTFSLDEPSLARKPNAATLMTWNDVVNVAPGTLGQFSLMATAIKATLPASSELVIAVG